MSVSSRPKPRKPDVPRYAETLEAGNFQGVKLKRDETAALPGTLATFTDGEQRFVTDRWPVWNLELVMPFNDVDAAHWGRDTINELLRWYAMAVEALDMHGHEAPAWSEPVPPVSASCPETCRVAEKLRLRLLDAYEIMTGDLGATLPNACDVHREAGYLAGKLEVLMWCAPESRYGRERQGDLQNGQEEGRKRRLLRRIRG